MLDKLTGKLFSPLIILGFVLHLLLSALTFHPDLRAYVLASRYIRQGEFFTFYDHVSSLPQGDEIKKIYGDDIFIYPPLAYHLPNLFFLPFSSLLQTPSDTILLHDSDLNGKLFHFYLLLFKLPFLITLFVFVLVLPRLFPTLPKGRLISLLILYSPLSFFVVSSVGQSDIFIALFLSLSLYFTQKNKYPLASIFIGLSSLIKPVGLSLLPLLFIKDCLKKGFWSAVKSTLPGALVFLVGIAPYLFSPGFRSYALFSSLIQKSTVSGINLTSTIHIPYLYIAYFLILLFLYFKKISLISSVVLTIFATLAFNHFHLQWFYWLFPLLFFLKVPSKKVIIVLSLISWLSIWLSFDQSLNLGLLTALRANHNALTPGPLSGSILVTFARSLLISLFIYLFYDSVKKN